MNKFVYVFSEKDKDKLVNNGLKLLKIDKRNSLYVLALNTDNNFTFELFDGLDKYSLSNTLTF